ncbi:hypothetical protein WJX82_010306 [Trebouxia sp. C0006]
MALSHVRFATASTCPNAVHRPKQISLTTCSKRPEASRPFGVVLPSRKPGKTICQAASGDQKDFSIDTFLGEVAEKYENAQNKPAVAAWAGGAVFAIFFAEWLIHKPGLNILLGFPIQLFGLLLLPGAILKYLVEKESPADDVKGALNKLAKRLPGLEKESF